MYAPFQSWDQLLDHIRAEYPLFYHAPMDQRPAMVSGVLRKDGKVRVSPFSNEADPFTADIGHLDRFRKYSPRYHVVRVGKYLDGPARIQNILVWAIADHNRANSIVSVKYDDATAAHTECDRLNAEEA